MGYRFSLILCLLIGVMPAIGLGQIFKCESNGRISYSSKPCPQEAVSSVVETKSEASSTLKVSGSISINGRRMVIKDALALREVGEKSEEVHLYLYPFDLTPVDRKKIREFKGHALSPRHDQSRNPDPSLWKVTPIVVFQFVLKEPRLPLALNNVRHWRFVSWMDKVPKTLNYRDATQGDLVQILRESRVDNGVAIHLKAEATQNYVTTLYSWDVDVNVPLVTPAR